MFARIRSTLDGRAVDLLVVTGLILIAAVLRLVDLPTRGTWDADQGHDMLVLRALVLDGQIPTLGPPTSIGDFHHGVLYYYLLAPAAALSNVDPLGVVLEIALAGVAAVAVTWWLARSIGGSVAGAIAGLLMAVSASAVEESTFIWNPNLIALASSIALAAAWRAWTTRRERWWIVSGIGAIVTMHSHVLGAALLPAIAALLVADLRRREAGPSRARVARAAIVVAALLVASYVPLAIHELTGDFSETRAAVDFIVAGGSATLFPLPIRFLVITLRVLAWPLTGLITNAPTAAMLAAVGVVAGAIWLARSVRGPQRTAAQWLGASLLWTVVALTIGAGSLATVVPGLPNDHYHAFADPIVFVIVGLGAAALARWRPEGRPVGPTAAGLACAAIIAFNVTIWPPPIAPDGGWPAGEAAGDRILQSTATGSEPDPLPVLHSLPEVKSADAARFPLVRRGAHAGPVEPGGLPHVVLCDGLFRDTIGAECGGPAEDPLVAPYGVILVDRFEAAPGRWVSVYLPP